MSSTSPVENPQPAPESAAPATRLRLSRLVAPDALRGLIMVLMALDHANYFIARQHARSEFWFAPPPTYTSDLTFVTRLVTHLAAPGFFFLMGVGVILFANARRAAGWTKGAIMRHLALRGVILIVLQLLIENRASPLADSTEPGDFWARYFGVLYGLGGAMILGALLLRLPWPAVVGVGLLAIIATQVLLPNPADAFNMNPAQMLLFAPGVSDAVNVFYPVVPWFGIATLGIAFGRWLLRNERQAYLGALLIGVACLTLFVATRATVSFTDIHPPAGQGWVAFLNVTKYPPSISFILMMLGADLVLLYLLSLTARRTSPVAGPDNTAWFVRPLVVYGRSALFFYLVHLFLYAGIGLLIAPHGMELVQMYPFWLLGLVILYPLCLWYGNFKQRQPPNSVWRFL